MSIDPHSIRGIFHVDTVNSDGGSEEISSRLVGRLATVEHRRGPRYRFRRTDSNRFRSTELELSNLRSLVRATGGAVSHSIGQLEDLLSPVVAQVVRNHSTQRIENREK